MGPRAPLDAGSSGVVARYWVTLATFAWSLLLAVLIGVVLGIVVGGSRIGRRALTLTLEFIKAVPPPALVRVVEIFIGTLRQPPD